LEWAEVWLPALILMACTGFGEELVFRGLLQQVASDALGRWAGPYVAVLFAVLHVGYLSFADVVFVFAIALFFGWAADRSRSIVGVTVAHGLINIALFLVVPFIV
jgi:membrane protease YdiL (CAAX protease family)